MGHSCLVVARLDDQVRNLPPEWEALFKGLNETLRSLGAHGVTKKEAQMLFAMASDALVPATPVVSSPPPSASHFTPTPMMLLLFRDG